MDGTAISRKRLSIDSDDLEMALTWRNDEGGHYLDLATGEVVTWTGHEDGELSEDEIDAGLAEGRLLAIEPLPSSVEYGWMQEFAASVTDPGLRKLLEVALDGSGAFRRFKGVLADHRAERERWVAVRGERLREAMREWLEGNGIEATTEPRRRSG